MAELSQPCTSEHVLRDVVLRHVDAFRTIFLTHAAAILHPLLSYRFRDTPWTRGTLDSGLRVYAP